VKRHVAHHAPRQRLRGRLAAHHLFHRVRDRGGLAHEQRALIGVLGEQHRAVRDQVGRRVVARDDQREAEAEQIFFAELLSVELGVEQRTHQVVAARDAPLGEQLRELGVDVGRGLDRVLDAVFAALDHRLGPVEERLAAVLGHADHLADHEARQVARELRHQIGLAARREAVDQPARDRADPRLHRVGAPARERARDQRAQAVVARRVHRLDLRQEADRDVGVLGRERRGVGRGVAHVRIARDRPDVGRGVAVDRVFVAQPAIDRVRVRLEIGARGVVDELAGLGHPGQYILAASRRSLP
jgi:hypothetical protein